MHGDDPPLVASSHVDEMLGLEERVGKRFFDNDVAAGVQRGFGKFGMAVQRRADVHDVHVAAAEPVVPISERCGAGDSMSQGSGCDALAVHYRRHGRASRETELLGVAVERAQRALVDRVVVVERAARVVPREQQHPPEILDLERRARNMSPSGTLPDCPQASLR